MFFSASTMEIHYCTQRSAKKRNHTLRRRRNKRERFAVGKERCSSSRSVSQAGFTHSHDFCKKPSETLIWVEGERSSHFGKCANNELNRWIESKNFFFCGFKFHSLELSTVWRVYSFKFLFYELSAVADERRFQWRNFSSLRE